LAISFYDSGKQRIERDEIASGS